MINVQTMTLPEMTTEELTAISTRAQGKIANLRPQYTCDATSYRKSSGSWRPTLKPQDIIDMDVPFGVNVRNLKVKGAFNIAGTRHHAFQLGRAHAQIKFWHILGMDNGSVIIEHTETKRRVLVGMKDGQPTVHEWHSGAWQDHALSQREASGLQLVQLQSAQGALQAIYFVYGNTYYHRDTLKDAGGKYGKSFVGKGARQKGYQFIGELPAHVRSLISESQENARSYNDETRFSKYHFIVKMLMGSKVTAISQDGIPANQFRAWAHDAYIRELWQVAGYEYTAFPTIA